MTRYLPQIDSNPSNLCDPSDILSAQLTQLNLLANSTNSNDIQQQQQQQGQDMNLLMNTLLMMPFWSNICAPNLSMPILYPNNLSTTATTNQNMETLPTANGA